MHVLFCHPLPWNQTNEVHYPSKHQLYECVTLLRCFGRCFWQDLALRHCLRWCWASDHPAVCWNKSRTTGLQLNSDWDTERCSFIQDKKLLKQCRMYSIRTFPISIKKINGEFKLSESMLCYRLKNKSNNLIIFCYYYKPKKQSTKPNLNRTRKFSSIRKATGQKELQTEQADLLQRLWDSLGLVAVAWLWRVTGGCALPWDFFWVRESQHTKNTSI